jgi:HSP20 family protein
MFSLIPWRKERRRSGTLLPRGETPFGMMRRELESVFDRLVGEWPWILPEPFERPAWGIEMEEKEKEYVLRLEVPGFELPELVVEVRGELLTVRAEHKVPKETKEVKEVKEVEEPETRYARFERTVTLPVGIELEKMEARYRNGVLEIHLPKVPEVVPRRIEVKT